MMTAGDYIVLAILGVAVVCSISLFLWLRHLIRRDGKDKTPAQKPD